jgi:GNAT superfamily N-acetyltransferase
MELIHELAEFEKAPAAVTVTLEHFEESGFGPQPVWWAFVAETRGQIVGMALYYIRYSTWKGQRLFLEDLIVSGTMRGHGIGTRLFERCLQEARDRNLEGMTWQVLDWNEPALAFYRKYGAAFDPEWINGSISFSEKS